MRQTSDVEDILVISDLEITDPETMTAILAIPKGIERDTYVTSCLRIGVLALKSAKGLVDEKAVRHAGEQIIDQLGNTLTKYFDPKDGLFQSRVAALAGDGGELSTLMKTQITEAQKQFDTMPVAMQGVMQQSVAAITAQFSLDDPASALSRLVRDLTNNHG